MIRLDLSRLFARQAAQAKSSMLSRLRRGVDNRFRALPGKKEDDGKPLGGRGVPAAIEAGSVSVSGDGWSILFGPPVSFFHSGRRRGKPPEPKPTFDAKGRRRKPRKKDQPVDTRARVQPPRPVVGFSRAEFRTWKREVETEIARQITAQLDTGSLGGSL